MTGGAGSTGTVTLGTAAPAGGAVVTLTSSNINAATVPASVTVAANATTATFAIATKAVTAVTAVTITATYNGVAKTATLTVNPPAALALAGVTMNPATMIFGSTSTGTVTLTSAAPAGGAVVALSSSEWVSFVSTRFGHGPGRGHVRSVHGDHRNRASDDDHHGELQRCEQDRNADLRLSNRDCVDLHTQPGDRR